MVNSCVAFGCSYRYNKEKKIGMFSFPKEASRRKLWIRAVKRANWEPSSNSRICGKHFQTGKPSDDVNHPDYVPSIFTFTSSRRSSLLYEKRKAHLAKREEINSTKKKYSELEDNAAESLLLLHVEPMQEDAAVVMEEPEEVCSQPQHSEELKLLHDKIKLLELENQQYKDNAEKIDKEVKLLRAERNILSGTLLDTELTTKVLSDPKYLALHTGLHSIALFKWLVKVCEDNTTADFLSRETQLLMVLTKVKLDPLLSKLAFDFNVSNRTVERVFKTWIPLLAGKLKQFITWPSKKALRKYCPESFKNTDFKKAVCIIDCTEIPTQIPGNQLAKSQMWSSYKNHHTIKCLVGTTPSGHICFLSEVFSGRTSDKEITLQSGFLEKLSPGDLVIADRGFNLEEHFEAKEAKLVVPSRTKGKKQFSKHEVYNSKKISNVRIHVERVIGLFKKFRILKHIIPITFLDYMDNVIIICAGISNLCKGIVN